MKTKIYSSVKAFVQANPVPWKWPNFKPQELACKDGSIMIDTEALGALQALRDVMGAPLVILSAYRSPAHNARVKGAPRSYHMQAMAYDVKIAGHDPIALEYAAKRCGFRGIGRYPESGFIHLDTGPAREWGGPWPVDADAQGLADLADDLRAVGIGAKVQHPLKRKQRLPA